MNTSGNSNLNPKPNAMSGRGAPGAPGAGAARAGAEHSAADLNLWETYARHLSRSEPRGEPHDLIDLAAFVDRTLSAADRDAMEAHLASCPEDLRGVIDAMRLVSHVSHVSPAAAAAAPSERATGGVFSFARALAARGRAWRRSLEPADWFGLAAAIAAMIAISMLGYFTGVRAPRSDPDDVQPQVERLASDLSVGPLAEDAAPDLDVELMAILVGEGS